MPWAPAASSSSSAAAWIRAWRSPCARARWAPSRVRGVYVDTGLMREGETEFVGRLPGVAVEHAGGAVPGRAGRASPIPSGSATSSARSSCACRNASSKRAASLEESWILGQGTIYPDTIESGGTAKAAVIKTHHNRVAGIQKLIESGRIVEPLKSFYKDEVREVGRELGLPAELLDRHPFPGPGLAIRCLCSRCRRAGAGHRRWLVIPVNSVGVQGDSRSYAPVLAIDSADHGARHRADQPPPRRQSRDRAVAHARAVCRNAGARQFPHARAHRAAAPRRRNRAPAIPRERLSTGACGSSR